ncbi:winged helix-turn-helix domain-containing protein [Micromonospora sp. NPDC048909]|uniref:winged helix-turn-helix domain-containing protein n=1 Tax=Micromonospora sp. NPDC048909 TaxID=3155643 RepID=UPI0033EBE6C9
MLTPSDPVGSVSAGSTETGVIVEISVVVRAAGPGTEAARALVERISAVVAGAAPPGEPPARARVTLDAPEAAAGRWPRRLRVAPDPAGTGLVLRPVRRTALLDGAPLTMPRREYDLLLFLARHPYQAMTRGQLLHDVWGYEACLGARTVDVHVRRIRQKLADRGRVITTVHGVGYRLDGIERLHVTAD